jgi:hypothetical protein
MRTLRQTARFDTGLSVSAESIHSQLERMKGRNIVITSDLPVRRDGLPYSTASEPADPGVAVWWVDKTGAERVMACDRWRKVRDNMRAIDASIDALRGLDRWGASEAVKRALSGFAALPPPSGDAPRGWREILGGPWPEEMSSAELLVLARSRHRRGIQIAHPDQGGNQESAIELNIAIAAAERELA